MKFWCHFLVVAMVAAFALAPIGLTTPHDGTSSVSVSASDIALAQFPGIACATEGPVKYYPSADKTKERNCWWGKEVLLGKTDSHRITEVGAGAAGVSTLFAPGILPARVAQGLIAVAAGGGPLTMGEISRAIDNGTCLKVVMVAHIVPTAGTYYCA